MKNAATNWKFAGKKKGRGAFHPTSTDPGRQPDPEPFYLSAFNKRRIFFTGLDLADKNWERILEGEHAPKILDPIENPLSRDRKG